MAPRASRQRPHLLIVDPYNLLPVDLRAEVMLCTRWSIASSSSRRSPSLALLVTGAQEKPSVMFHHFFTSIAAIPTIIYDAEPTTSREANVFSAGANGYVVPGVTIKELMPIMEVAHFGGFSICSRAMALLRDQLAAPVQFSRREHQVVARIALGADMEAVAEELHLPLLVVDETLKRACHKAGVDSLTALSTWWGRWTMMDELPEPDDEDTSQILYALTA